MVGRPAQSRECFREVPRFIQARFSPTRTQTWLLEIVNLREVISALGIAVIKDSHSLDKIIFSVTKAFGLMDTLILVRRLARLAPAAMD